MAPLLAKQSDINNGFNVPAHMCINMMLILFISVLNVQRIDLNNRFTCDLEAKSRLKLLPFHAKYNRTKHSKI